MDEQSRRSARRWAVEEFGGAQLGDVRRRARLLAMATRVGEAPAGRVSEVFRRAEERQGAYDFLESEHVHASALTDALGQGCAERSASLPFVFVPVDGTSLRLVDRARCKDFGAVGTYTKGARGLKVIDAIAVSPDGVPVGVCALQWWKRPSSATKKRASVARKAHEKETQHWLDAIDRAADTFEKHAPQTRPWFQIDREGDAWLILRHLENSGKWFTVRSSTNRRLCTDKTAPYYLHDARRHAQKHEDYLLRVTAGPKRKARVARMSVRTATVTLKLRNRWTKTHSRVSLNVVFVREAGTTPRGEKPIAWTLLTNHPVDTSEDVKLVIYGYTQRWRIEEFHKAWKSGVCDVENTQLHERAHVIKWATILAGVAVRAERLKKLSREQPDLDATTELSPVEVEALILLKRRQKKRTEVIPDRMPTLAEAIGWMADLGGYIGKSSGGPPGAIVIGRGLERVLMAAEVLDELKAKGKIR